VNAQATPGTCAGCGRPATRNVGGRYICDGPSCDKGQGTRNKDKVRSEGSNVVHLVPSSLSKPRPEPELSGLIRDYERGLLQPVSVQLGPLSVVGSRVADSKGETVVVTEAMHRAAADIRLLLGLRLAVSEDRPLPYSTRFCAERCGLHGHQEASRVLRALERLGVVGSGGSMKPRGQPHGTKLYEAPG
jgi:hypothetical protein